MNTVKNAALAIWRTGDLVFIVFLMFVAGGVMSSALMSRDFLAGTDLKTASSSAPVDSLNTESQELDKAMAIWWSRGIEQQSDLAKAIGARPNAVKARAEANRGARQALEAVAPSAAPRNIASFSADSSATADILAYCAQGHRDCSHAAGLQRALAAANDAERAVDLLDQEIAARRQAIRDIDEAARAMTNSPFYPDAPWLTKREVRHALVQWRSYGTNRILWPFVKFASAPIFILNLTLATLMGATGAAMAYLLVRIGPQKQLPNFVVTIMLGALASSAAFLVYSAGLGVITASSTASLAFPDPLFVTGISLVSGFNASGILRVLGNYTAKVLPGGDQPADASPSSLQPPG